MEDKAILYLYNQDGKYEHDTYYYGMEVLNTINAKVGHRPDIDRGGLYF